MAISSRLNIAFPVIAQGKRSEIPATRPIEKPAVNNAEKTALSFMSCRDFDNADMLSLAVRDRLSEVFGNESPYSVKISGNTAFNDIKAVPEDELSELLCADVVELPLSQARYLAAKGMLADMTPDNKHLILFTVRRRDRQHDLRRKTYGVAPICLNPAPYGILYNAELLEKYAPDYNVYKMYKTKPGALKHSVK